MHTPTVVTPVTPFADVVAWFTLNQRQQRDLVPHWIRHDDVLESDIFYWYMAHYIGQLPDTQRTPEQRALYRSQIGWFHDIEQIGDLDRDEADYPRSVLITLDEALGWFWPIIAADHQPQPSTPFRRIWNRIDMTEEGVIMWIPIKNAVQSFRITSYCDGVKIRSGDHSCITEALTGSQIDNWRSFVRALLCVAPITLDNQQLTAYEARWLETDYTYRLKREDVHGWMDLVIGKSTDAVSVVQHLLRGSGIHVFSDQPLKVYLTLTGQPKTAILELHPCRRVASPRCRPRVALRLLSKEGEPTHCDEWELTDPFQRERLLRGLYRITFFHE